MNKIFILIISFAFLFAKEFDELKEFGKFKNEYNKEFFNYKKEIEKEFREYKKIVLEEFKEYKKEVSQYWKDAKISNKKVWVEYSDDFKNRKVVDFKNKKVEISVIDDNVKGASKKLVASLKDLLLEDKVTAYKRDKLSNRIEKRLKTLKDVKTAKIDKEKILTPIFFKNSPTPKKVRYKIKEILKSSDVEVKIGKNNKLVYTLKFELPSDFILKKSKQYKQKVFYYSQKRNLTPALIFAIVHTESDFNPLARSPIPAYGLMQIVPSTAGRDASKFLYGKNLIFSPSYLYNANNNLNLGSAYFYILYYRYLKYIKNPKSRLYCAICAYNGGIGKVFKAFSGTTHIIKSSEIINSLTSEEVYNILFNKMPDETKNYLYKVLKRTNLYYNVLKRGMI